MRWTRRRPKIKMKIRCGGRGWTEAVGAKRVKQRESCAKRFSWMYQGLVWFRAGCSGLYYTSTLLPFVPINRLIVTNSVSHLFLARATYLAVCLIA